MLSCVGWYAWREWRVLVRMIGFISTLVTTFLNHIQYSAIADLHTLHNPPLHAHKSSPGNIIKTQELALRITPNMTHNWSLQITLQIFTGLLRTSRGCHLKHSWLLLKHLNTLKYWTSRVYLPPRTHLSWTALKNWTGYICNCRYIASASTTQKAAYVDIEKCLPQRCITTVAARAP
jgi:hypothetical protein